VTPDELRDELARGAPRRAYLLLGAEALLREEALAALRAAVLAGSAEDFDLDRLDGERLTPAGLVDAVRTLPVVAPRRLVVLREPEPRSGGRGVGDALAALLPELGAGQSVLVVVAEKADARLRWVKAFPADAVVHCDPPRGERDLVAFVRDEARRQGVALEPGAAVLLAERVGPQLLLLRRELEKIALLGPAGGAVARAQVAAGTALVAVEPIWDLTDAIGEGRAAEALRVLARVLAAGAAPPVVLGSLASHFRRLLRVRAGGAVQAPPFVRRKLDQQARRYAPRRLLSCLRAIHETDLALKGAGHVPPELALERLVLGLSA
jgi:DNA polymerase-3 subunit delta